MQNKLAPIRKQFILVTLLLTLLLIAPMPFFLKLTIDVSLLYFFLAEVSLVFLVAFANFVQEGLLAIFKIAAKYLCLISLCFTVLLFIPFSPEHKIFSLIQIDSVLPNFVRANVFAWITINFLLAILLTRELKREVTNEQAELKPTTANDLNNTELTSEPEAIQQTIQPKQQDEFKSNINSLFDIYLDDYEEGSPELEEKIDNIEAVLFESLDPDVVGTQCLSSSGETLHDQIFNWHGYDSTKLIDIFNSNSGDLKSCNQGGLCQFLMQDNELWYLIAKYRGNYLLFQTDKKSPDVLLSTCFKVIKNIKASRSMA